MAQKKAAALPPLSATLQVPSPHDELATELELDELWLFVASKAPPLWVWIALCVASHQVVAYVVGDRSAASCRRLWEQIPPNYRTAHCCTDFWEAYQKVIPDAQHTAAGKDSGLTAHVERWNNTLRQRVGRFVCKTLSFSKSDTMHEVCLQWFIHYYNPTRLPT